MICELMDKRTSYYNIIIVRVHYGTTPNNPELRFRNDTRAELAILGHCLDFNHNGVIA